jgi:putative glutamine amidotransferase
MRPTIGINMDVTADGWLRMGLPVSYPDAVLEAGGRPRLVPAIEDERLLRDEVDGVDAFLFMGGPDYPPSLYGEPPHEKANPMHERRAAVDMLIAGLVLRRGIPVLGICGGCQLLNIAMGGKLVQHLDRAEAHAGGQRHEVELVPGSRLARIFGTDRIAVNSYHHQAADPAAIGRDLVVTARADDGTVEAVESTGPRFLVGVQWHPERLDEDHRGLIFGALVAAAAAAVEAGRTHG